VREIVFEDVPSHGGGACLDDMLMVMVVKRNLLSKVAFHSRASIIFSADPEVTLVTIPRPSLLIDPAELLCRHVDYAIGQ
jgi:hypothetical protein